MILFLKKVIGMREASLKHNWIVHRCISLGVGVTFCLTSLDCCRRFVIKRAGLILVLSNSTVSGTI